MEKVSFCVSMFYLFIIKNRKVFQLFVDLAPINDFF